VIHIQFTVFQNKAMMKSLLMNRNSFRKVLVIMLFLQVKLLIFSQETVANSTRYKVLDIAFKTSNWDKVIDNGKIILVEFKKSKFKQDDSLKIIESFDVFYKMIISYTWLDKQDTANSLFENFIVDKVLFNKHLNYSDYYRLSAKAHMYFIGNKPDSASSLFQKAFDLASNNLQSNKYIYLNALKNLAIYYIEACDYEKAIALLYKTMFDLKEQMANSSIYAELYYYLYLVYYSESNYQLALEHSLKGIEELQVLNSENDNWLYTKLLLAAGVSYFQLNEYYTAKEFLHKALDFHGDYFHDKNPEIALNFNYLARVYRKLDNIDLAIEYKRKASAIYKNIYQSDKHFRVGFIDFTLSIYNYERVGSFLPDFDPELYEPLNKLDYVFTSLPSNYELSNSSMWTYQYTTQAFIYVKISDYVNSISYLQKALKIKEQKKGVNKAELTNFYLLIGHGYYNLKQFDSASYYYQKTLFSEIDKELFDDNQVDGEAKNIQPTASLVHLIYSNAKCFDAIANVGNDENKRKYAQIAYNYYFKCDKLVENLSGNIRKREDKLFLNQQMDVIYNMALNNCFKQASLSNNKSIKDNFLAKAFYYSQKNKSNLLEELITKSGAGKYAGIPDSLLREELELKSRIAFWERQIQRKIIRDPNDFDHILIYYRKLIDKPAFNKTSFSDSLFKYTRKYEQLIDLYNVNYPKYFELKYSKKVYKIGEIQSKLDDNSVLLDYHIDKNRLDVFLITRDNFIVKTVILEEPIDSIINIYRKSISGYFRKEDFLKNGYGDFIKNGNKLYNYLIKPIENQIENKGKLIIIVSEELSLLPFETLVTANNSTGSADLAKVNYLIKKFDIVYNYSGNLWMNSIKKTDEYSKRTESLLAMAPVFDPDKMNIELNKPVQEVIYNNKMGGIDLPDLSPLPATKMAVEDVIEMADNLHIKTSKFLYNQAGKNKFMFEISDKKYVLIATHGRSDDESPKFSGLYFAPMDSLNQQPEKVFLYSNEIYNLNLTSDLLVLYACETGVGQVKKGEGVMTISRGFMASGAANIVHTLWSIQDVSTKDLVVDLYKGVFEKRTYSNSLRMAKLKMIEMGIIPFHWAGLVLLGN
jgi:CHAT domain-containing protein/tetratricopeptide (TPR) repeat protein